MPYNTRRVSLSLTSLGIHVPGQHASRGGANRSPSTNKSSASNSENPPTKRVKRSHTLESNSSSVSSPLSLPRRSRNASSASDPQQLSAAPLPVNTPPPSPRQHGNAKIDKQGIKDDVVVAVLEQLESTGNRPHLIRELATILSNQLKTVESSSNPTAIISSRLTSYLRRPWTALAPCPLAKEQVTQHQRRVYYYLITIPRQPIPEYIDALPQNRIISPSVSSGPDEDIADQDLEGGPSQPRAREDLSPSPEIDLSAPDLELNNNAHPLNNLSFQDSSNDSQPPRITTPPLEHDEREFSRTASVMQARKQTEQAEQAQLQAMQQATPQSQPSPTPSDSANDNETPAEALPTISAYSSPSAGIKTPEDLYEMPEATAESNEEAAAALFGPQSHRYLLTRTDDAHLRSSPMMRPVTGSTLGMARDLDLSKPAMATGKGVTVPDRASGNLDADIAMKDEGGVWWNDLRNPENVGLSELDDLLGAF